MQVYVDGSGGPKSKYGFFIKDTGKSLCQSLPDMTNNVGEYRAIIAALKEIGPTEEHITIYSDSETVVNQINHKYGINKDHLRDLARAVWEMLPKFPNCTLVWIPREKNLAGKMLGS